MWVNLPLLSISPMRNDMINFSDHRSVLVGIVDMVVLHGDTESRGRFACVKRLGCFDALYPVQHSSYFQFLFYLCVIIIYPTSVSRCSPSSIFLFPFLFFLFVYQGDYGHSGPLHRIPSLEIHLVPPPLLCFEIGICVINVQCDFLYIFYIFFIFVLLFF